VARQASQTSVPACPLILFNPSGHVFKMGNFGLRRQAERDAALEKDRTLITKGYNSRTRSPVGGLGIAGWFVAGHSVREACLRLAN